MSLRPIRQYGIPNWYEATGATDFALIDRFQSLEERDSDAWREIVEQIKRESGQQAG